MNQNSYRHVVVLGIDGAGAFIRDAHTPAFDRIFAEGAITYAALASNPTISAECWGSMLLGVGPEVHKLTNEVVSTKAYPSDSPFPSLFRRISREIPGAQLGSFCQWNPITAGMIEKDVPIATATAPDTELTPMICKYIREEKPTFLFIQFDSVDGVGHRNGYGTPAHLQRIGEVDALVDQVYTATQEAGMEDTLFVLISDHGGTNPGTGTGSHGGWTDAEKYVTLAATGKTVVKGLIGEANVRDIAAIVLYALGIAAPEFDEAGWTSQVPENLFADPTLPAYRDISHLTGAALRISKVPHTSVLL